jgi:hypothetical protein
MRQADRDEVMAASGKTPLQALEIGLVESLEPYTVLEAGQPIAMFGVTRIAMGVGAPWLLGSDGVTRHWFEFARRSRDEFARIRRPWAHLTNYVSDANELHKRWLEWLGADFVELDPHYGVGRAPFWRFEFSV